MRAPLVHVRMAKYRRSFLRRSDVAIELQLAASSCSQVLPCLPSRVTCESRTFLRGDAPCGYWNETRSVEPAALNRSIMRAKPAASVASGYGDQISSAASA